MATTERGRLGGLTRLLGWSSLGLGAVQLAAPRRVARLAGVDDSATATLVVRAVGRVRAAAAFAGDAHDRTKHALRQETDRPHALREAILSVRNAGVVSVIGVYGGFVDKFPMGSVMNRSLTIRSGQCHVHRYLRPLLDRIRSGELDPTFVISHRMTLDEAPHGYRIFRDKQDECNKIVLRP